MEYFYLGKWSYSDHYHHLSSTTAKKNREIKEHIVKLFQYVHVVLSRKGVKVLDFMVRIGLRKACNQRVQDVMDVKSSSCHPSSVHYLRRRKTALWVTVSLLALSLVVMAVGLISATRTDNVPVAGYYAGIAVSDGPLSPSQSINVFVLTLIKH